MSFFHKTDKDVLSADRDRLTENVRTAEVFAVSAPDGSEIAEKLNGLADALKFSSPSRDPEVVALDKKISDKLGDLKIALNKAKNNENYAACAAQVEELTTLITQRNVRVG